MVLEKLLLIKFLHKLNNKTYYLESETGIFMDFTAAI